MYIYEAVSKATVNNSRTPRTTLFSREKGLPWVGFEPTTLCSLRMSALPTELCTYCYIPGMSLAVGCGREARLDVAPSSHVLWFLLDPHHVCCREPSHLLLYQVIGEWRDLCVCVCVCVCACVCVCVCVCVCRGGGRLGLGVQ